MLFNTTNYNEEFNYQSKKILGKPYSFLQKLKMNGVGSSRLMIAELSAKLQPKQKQFSELNYGNIELRQNGVLIHFTNRLERFSWVIPYYKLIVYNSEFFSVHADGSYIRFHKNKNYKANKKFIDKMIDIKNEFLNLEYYDG